MEEEIVGVFNGENMETDDGRTFPVNGNYASKSKLVEGDKLKMTFDDRGFIFKQIDSVPRKRGIAEVVKIGHGIGAMLDGISYKILVPTVYYFKLEMGDDIVIVLPSDRLAEYAAVENVVKKQR
jgi:hypothetical protein